MYEILPKKIDLLLAALHFFSAFLRNRPDSDRDLYASDSDIFAVLVRKITQVRFTKVYFTNLYLTKE